MAPTRCRPRSASASPIACTPSAISRTSPCWDPPPSMAPAMRSTTCSSATPATTCWPVLPAPTRWTAAPASTRRAMPASSAGVSVSLMTGLSSGGDAQRRHPHSASRTSPARRSTTRSNGNAGNNVLAGWRGADALDGGAGIDTASYAASSAGVSVSLMTGLGSGGDAQGDTLISIENLTGSALDDTFEGNGGTNLLVGGAGMDTASYRTRTGRGDGQSCRDHGAEHPRCRYRYAVGL